MIADYDAYGIKESGVLFHVVEFPRHGALDVTVWEKAEDTIFTLLDLNTDKVHYVNSRNSIATEDRIVFEVEFVLSNPSSLPRRLTRRHRFSLPITVVGVERHETDDAGQAGTLPSIDDSAPSEPMRLAKGTKKQLSLELLRLDTSEFVGSPADVVFLIVSKDDAGGFLEDSRRASHALDDFTLETLMGGDVYYVDRGQVSESQVGLKMTNKRTKTDSAVITLRIQTFKLEVIEVNNTGLTLASGTNALITPHNLTFTTNAPEQSLNIR